MPSPDLRQALEKLRAPRAFVAERALRAKLHLLDDYFRHCSISACLVGVSGGLDSAVVLGLLQRAKQMPGSPLRRVLAVLVPMFVEAGATNQEGATARGREVAAAFQAECVTVDLSGGLRALKADVDSGWGKVGQPWAAGQLVSYARTPAFYYLASLLCEEGHPCLVCGTTNRDEGSYIGFFGKASDGMVDLQPISDLHKSEVTQVAHLLGVPKSVIEATPTGDTYDGRPDVEMIGAPYDFLELYELWLEAGRPELSFCEEWRTWAANIEELHGKNLHKYQGGSPAIHLDIYPRAVPGGWRSEAPPAREPSGGNFVAPFQLDWSDFPDGFCHPCKSALADFGDSAIFVENVLSPEECQWLSRQVIQQELLPVGLDGMRSGFKEGDPIGSYRATTHDARLAELLWERLREAIPSPRVMDGLTPTDHGGYPVWRAVGVNPVLRFLCYQPGGSLVPHYDAGFDFGDFRRHTLMSLVVYLEGGGATRFLLDRQRHLPTAQRNFADWTHFPHPDEILLSVSPAPGQALAFDHRLLHDAATWSGPGPRILLRTDVIFERCGLQPQPWPRVALPKARAPLGVGLDPFYRDLYTGDMAALEDAGYFEESRTTPTRQDPDWMVTPVHKLETPDDTASWLAVVLTTGALCPVHPGHIQMLEIARTALRAQGAQVLGGYLSPAHDEYVDAKCGPDVANAARRVRLCQEAVQGRDWLMVDPWEALHTDRAVNFTQVIDHLERYLSRHVRCARPVQVVYVFGSDNARFARTFLLRNRAVCVVRPGYPLPAVLVEDARVTYVHSPSAPDLASSQVRSGDESSLLESVRSLWRGWREPQQRPRIQLYLRHEGDWLLEPWLAGRDLALLRAAHRTFVEGLEAILRASFAEHADFQLERLTLSDQQPPVHPNRLVISLDPCIQGDYNLRVSRGFPLADSGQPSQIVARPGWPDLAHQVAELPPGEYVLFDDDIATGATVETVRQALPAHCRVVETRGLCTVTLCQSAIARDGGQGGDYQDLADSRDFLFGAREGGLVVRLPDGSLARTPYLLPYVLPSARTSVPLVEEKRFSRALWALNREFFQAVSPALTLAEVSPAARRLGGYLGIPPDSAVADLCEWHVARL